MSEVSFNFAIRPEPEVDFCREVAEQEQDKIAVVVNLQSDVTVTERNKKYQFSVKVSERHYELTESIVKICLQKLLKKSEKSGGRAGRKIKIKSHITRNQDRKGGTIFISRGTSTCEYWTRRGLHAQGRRYQDGAPHPF